MRAFLRLILIAPQVHHHSKKKTSSWLETDLDTGMTFDHCLESPRSPNLTSHLNRLNMSPQQQQQQYPQHQYKDNQHCSPSAARPEQNQQSYQTQVFQNHISSLSPQLREQIQQHQLKQLLLKDQMQGKGSPVQANVVPLYVNTESRKPGEFVKQPILEYILYHRMYTQFRLVLVYICIYYTSVYSLTLRAFKCNFAHFTPRIYHI